MTNRGRISGAIIIVAAFAGAVIIVLMLAATNTNHDFISSDMRPATEITAPCCFVSDKLIPSGMQCEDQLLMPGRKHCM